MKLITLLILLFAASPLAADCTPLQKALEVTLADGTACDPVLTWVEPVDQDSGESYGKIEILIRAPALVCRADFNADGRVNFLDLAAIAGGIFGTDTTYDLDADLDVTLADVALLQSVFFQSCEANL